MNDRPAKRIRLETSSEDGPALQSRGHNYGDVNACGPAPVQLGDNYGIQNHNYYQQPPADNVPDSSQIKCNALRESLKFPRMGARVNNVSKALPNTCTWLFRHKHFKSWHSRQALQQHNGFLWIRGKPGCGKSTIMKTVLEWAQKEARKRTNERKVIHYFFNARASVTLEKSTLGLYRFLVSQLLELYPCLQPHFLAKFVNKNPEQSDDAWSEVELQGFLREIVYLEHRCSLYILIDALDEGEDQRDVRDMINFLVDLAETALDPESSLDLRICLSSRHYPHISVKKGLFLTVEDQAEHDHDIQLYVRKKFLGQDGVADFNGTLTPKEQLAAEICCKSASIFLWVVLVLRLLLEVEDRGRPMSEMQDLLETIPSDLNELFEKILTRSERGVERCIATLQWVLFAARSLSPDELYLATEYSLSPASTNWAPPTCRAAPGETELALHILDCSRGLVEITTSQPPIVQFIHETVRDYFLRWNGLALLLPVLADNLAGISHEVLKTSCARYISACKVPEDLLRYEVSGHASNKDLARVKSILRLELPLIDYAVAHVFEHAEQAQCLGVSQEDFLRRRMSTDGNWEGTERTWRNVLERFTTRKYDDQVALSMFFTEKGHVNLLEQSLRVHNTVNSMSKYRKYGTLLSAAILNGHESCARLLIAKGANMNRTGHKALRAIFSSMLFLLPSLQESGWRPSHEELESLLFDMISCGSRQGVISLLDLGADVNSFNSDGKSTISHATRTKRTDIADVLLRDPRLDLGSIIARTSAENNLLAEAIEQNMENVERVILEKETPETISGLLGEALRRVAKDDIPRPDSILLLITKGVDVNAQGGKYGTALQAACDRRGNIEVVRLLLEHGADVNLQGGYYGTALQAACTNANNIEVVQLLLEHGADVNLQGGYHGTALHAVACWGDTEMLHTLIYNGADVRARPEPHLQTALVYASEYLENVRGLNPEWISRLKSNVEYLRKVGESTPAQVSSADIPSCRTQDHA